MNYADIKVIDVQDGEGVRVSIYVSGCHFHCKGCHNKVAWDFNYGKEFTEKEIDFIIDAMGHSYIRGLSLLGGEPLELVNQQGLLPLVKKVKETYPDKNIWCYTGYDFEKDILNDMINKYDFTKELMSHIDIMVDGEFVEEQKLADLKFRGSTNQRKIDVQESLKLGRVVALKFGDESRYEKPVEIKVADGTGNDSKIALFEEYKFKNDAEEKVKEVAEKVTSEIIAVGADLENAEETTAEKHIDINEAEILIAAKNKNKLSNEELD